MSLFNKEKLSKKEFFSKLSWFGILTFIFSITCNMTFPGDSDTGFGAMHSVFIFGSILFLFVYLILVMKKSLNQNLDFEFDEESEVKSSYFWQIVFIFLISIGIITHGFWISSITMYNTSIEYQNRYTQISQEKEAYFDNMWKSEFLKDRIVERNKSTFLEVTKLLMDGRHDGDKLAWKWVQENQPVPYSEFTKFYSDLSAFIESQRAGYLELEKQSQEVSRANNTMLDTFPNNVYNKVLRIKHIEYQPGFSSTKTKQVFNTKIEDLE